MSIAIFSTQYPPHMGGIETFTRNLAGALAARGCEVIVVTNDTNGVGAGVTREDGFDVMRLPCLPLVDGRLPLPVPSAERSELIRQLRQSPLDGVLVNARFYPHSLLGMRLAREKGLRPLVLDHGSAYLSFSNKLLDPAVRLYERAITAVGKRYGAAYFGVSKKSAEWLGEFGIRAEGVITNSIDAAAYREQASDRDFRAELGIEDGRLLVAFVGRFIPEKGIASIIEASRRLETVVTRVTFALAGDGPLAEDVKAAQGESLRYVGRLARPDVSALLQQSDLLCLPTRSEGFSTTLLEASACGCPAVVTDVGGARELIPDEGHGTIIGSMEPDAIVGAVAGLAANREKIQQQSTACQELVEREFSWDKTAALLTKLVEEHSKS